MFDIKALTEVFDIEFQGIINIFESEINTLQYVFPFISGKFLGESGIV